MAEGMPDGLSFSLIEVRSGLDAVGCEVGRSDGLEGAFNREGGGPRLFRGVLPAVVGRGGKAPVGGSASGREERTGRDMLITQSVRMRIWLI